MLILKKKIDRIKEEMKIINKINEEIEIELKKLYKMFNG